MSLVLSLLVSQCVKHRHEDMSGSADFFWLGEILFLSGKNVFYSSSRSSFVGTRFPVCDLVFGDQK